MYAVNSESLCFSSVYDTRFAACAQVFARKNPFFRNELSVFMQKHAAEKPCLSAA